jgi:hypothetical protein
MVRAATSLMGQQMISKMEAATISGRPSALTIRLPSNCDYGALI